MTIKDIARLAGVTHSTVSRSLNDSPLVSQETKARIRKIAEEVGYSPNTFARKLVKGHSHTVGVFFLSRDEISLMENFGTQFLDGIAREALSHDYDLLFFTLTKDLSNRKSYLSLCREKHVEGAIFIGVSSNDPHLREIEASELPVCLIDFRLPGKNVGVVTTDNPKGISLALNYLYDMGHRAIGFIEGPEIAPVAVERMGAFLLWMRQKNLFREEWVKSGNFSKESGYRAGWDLLKEPVRPTAVLAANDYMALGALKAFRQGGLRVPEDLSLMGYDNAAAADFADPGLTTIGQNAVEMGAQAARFVFDRLDRKRPPKEILIVPSLVIRESVLRLG